MTEPEAGDLGVFMIFDPGPPARGFSGYFRLDEPDTLVDMLAELGPEGRFSVRLQTLPLGFERERPLPFPE